MLTIKAALTGALICAAATTAALAEPKTNMLHQWDRGLRRGGDRQARRDVHRRRRQVGADLDRRPHRQHARQAARRRRRRQRAARRPAQGPGNRRVERDRQDRQSRRPRHEGRLGQGRRARTAAGDEADRRLGRGADEHPSHQLDLGLDQGDGAGRHQGAAEDLGRVQRRLRQGGRRPSHLPRPFQRRTGPTRRPSRSSSTAWTIDLFKKAFVEGDTDGDALATAWSRRSSSSAPMVSKYMDPAIAGRDYQTADQHDRQEPGRLHDHGRLADRHLHRRRLQGGRQTTSARRRRPTGASRASSSIPIRSSSSSRRIRTTSPARSCSPISSCRRSSRPCSTRPRARSRRVSTSI